MHDREATSELARSPDVIVVAAGSSRRMGGIDKLAWTVGGRPLLATRSTRSPRPQGSRDRRRDAPAARRDRRGSLAAGPVRSVAAGGERRQDSVRVGFDALEAISRMMAANGSSSSTTGRGRSSASLVTAVVAGRGEYGAAIPVLLVAETVKRHRGRPDRGDRRPQGWPSRRRRGLPTGLCRAGSGLGCGRRRHLDRRGRPPGGL